MSKTRHIKKSRFDDDDIKTTNRRSKHARNIPGVGMRTVNNEYLEDLDITEDIIIHLNNIQIR